MGFVVGILANLGLTQRVAKLAAPFVLAIAALLALWGLYAGGKVLLHIHDQHVIKEDRQAANLKAMEGQATADAHAADQRVNDALANQQQKEAYGHAISQPKPGDSSDPRVRLNCERLRRAGQDTKSIPACGGR